MKMTKELKDKLEAYRELSLELNELANTKIFNAAMGAYAEVLACAALDLTLAKSENQSDYDATQGNELYQIKVRHRRVKGNDKREKGNVKFENLRMESDGTMKFDYLIAIVMDEQHTVTEAYKIPASFIEEEIGNNKKRKKRKNNKKAKTLVLTKEMRNKIQAYTLKELVGL